MCDDDQFISLFFCLVENHVKYSHVLRGNVYNDTKSCCLSHITELFNIMKTWVTLRNSSVDGMRKIVFKRSRNLYVSFLSN